MDNCYKAFLEADKVFFYDNSAYNTNNAFNYFAEKAENNLIIAGPQSVPQWFEEYVLRKIDK